MLKYKNDQRNTTPAIFPRLKHNFLYLGKKGDSDHAQVAPRTLCKVQNVQNLAMHRYLSILVSQITISHGWNNAKEPLSSPYS